MLVKIASYLRNKSSTFLFSNNYFKKALVSLYNALQSLSLRIELIGSYLISWSTNTDTAYSKELKAIIRLRSNIKKILKLQRKEYSPQKLYLYGLTSYQGLDFLRISGLRKTEERFKEYDLYNIFSSEDNILDLGCNNGFFIIYASYLFGCKGIGIDHNPYTIAVGKEVVKHLKLEQKVDLRDDTIQNFIRENKTFTKIISFATHFTNDKGYRVSISEHLRSMHSMLERGGQLLFETHMTHSDSKNREIVIEAAKGLFILVKESYFSDTQRRFFVLERDKL